MDISLIPIGNSKGIRLSKSIIAQYQLLDKVELILEKDYIILKAKDAPRQGWDMAFKQMHHTGDDTPLMPDVFEDETTEEWG